MTIAKPADNMKVTTEASASEHPYLGGNFVGALPESKQPAGFRTYPWV